MVNLNRHTRRAMDVQNHARFTDEMRPIPPSEWPAQSLVTPTEVWASRRFLAQIFMERHAIRISVCRTTLGKDGRWQDQITWDDLQRIKREIGRGEQCALEVYPAESDLVNVANMRHLWIPIANPLGIGWHQKKEAAHG